MITDRREFLGKITTIVIDRPICSQHPDHGFVYLCNYGHIEGTLGEDGEEIDAYLIGVYEAVKTYTGICIAIIHRSDDLDDKLVISPFGKSYNDDQILAFVEFQERFFNSSVVR